MTSSISNINPLMEAATIGDLGCIQHLLVSPTPDIVQDLLTAATQNSQLATVQFLLHRYPPQEIREETIRAAVYSGSIPLFSAFLSQDQSIINLRFDRRSTPLVAACMSKKPIQFLRFLLENGADPNRGPEDSLPTPLGFVGALYEDPAAVDLLLEYGARLEDPEATSDALDYAIMRGNEAVARRLLERGASLDKDDLLHDAARKGHMGIAKLLLQYGVPVDEKDKDGKTAVEVVREEEKKEGKDLSQMKQLLSQNGT